MKKVISFLIALVLFFVFALALETTLPKTLKTNGQEYRLLTKDFLKDRSYYGISENIGSNTMLMFGSSEFNHARKKNTHPANLFKGSNIDLMFVGAAYNQSLFFTTLLGSVSDSLQSKKAVLFLSPGWFKTNNIKPENFAMRFSKSQYLNFMRNANIDYATKKCVADRTESLLSIVNNDRYDFAKSVNNMYIRNDASFMDKITVEIDNKLNKMREYAQIGNSFKHLGIEINEKEPKYESKKYDWNDLAQKALEDQKRKANNNEYYISNKIWKKGAERKLNKKIRDFDDEMNGYSLNSPEFEDLKCFLKVCKQCKIKPLIILQPVNGKFYDKLNYKDQDRETRVKIYKEIVDIAKENDVEIEDFTKYEYTPYFLEDGTHPSQYGWEKFDEAIYKFYKEN